MLCYGIYEAQCLPQIRLHWLEEFSLAGQGQLRGASFRSIRGPAGDGLGVNVANVNFSLYSE